MYQIGCCSGLNDPLVRLDPQHDEASTSLRRLHPERSAHLFSLSVNFRRRVAIGSHAGDRLVGRVEKREGYGGNRRGWPCGEVLRNLGQNIRKSERRSILEGNWTSTQTDYPRRSSVGEHSRCLNLQPFSLSLPLLIHSPSRVGTTVSGVNMNLYPLDIANGTRNG